MSTHPGFAGPGPVSASLQTVIPHSEVGADAPNQPLAAIDRRTAGAGTSKAFFLRLGCLAGVFSIELILIPILLGKEGLVSNWNAVAAHLLRGAVSFAAIFASFAWMRYRVDLAAASRELAAMRPSPILVAVHLAALALFAYMCSALGSGSAPGWLTGAWLATGVLLIASAAFATINSAVWVRILQITGSLWIWALPAVLLAWFSDYLWPIASGGTFALSELLLKLVVPVTVADPARLVLGTDRFTVEISPACSGVEGIGLMLVFGIAFLAIFRNECRFPRSLLLLPAGGAIIYVLNSARIAALILIGNAGAEDIAIRGFHSQAGWIAFNLTAVGLALIARRVPWFCAAGHVGTTLTLDVPAVNPSVRWLLPLVVVLAAGAVSSAATGDFEWLYPLRFLAGAITLWILRQRYKDLNWHVSWFAPVTGILVFLLWTAFEPGTSIGADMPTALAGASPLIRNWWLTFRVLAAIVTAPIAEELAFRGFLYRRLISEDYDSVSFKRFSWRALLITAVVFGLLHGDRWLAGTIASVAYATVVNRKGSIGDAVVAHATTNALLALDVLAYHQWNFW